jgi:hypothetical protein
VAIAWKRPKVEGLTYLKSQDFQFDVGVLQQPTFLFNGGRVFRSDQQSKKNLEAFLHAQAQAVAVLTRELADSLAQIQDQIVRVVDDLEFMGHRTLQGKRTERGLRQCLPDPLGSSLRLASKRELTDAGTGSGLPAPRSLPP